MQVTKVARLVGLRLHLHLFPAYSLGLTFTVRWGIGLGSPAQHRYAQDHP